MEGTGEMVQLLGHLLLLQRTKAWFLAPIANLKPGTPKWCPLLDSRNSRYAHYVHTGKTIFKYSGQGQGAWVPLVKVEGRGVVKKKCNA